ncbi:hypothetical protein PFHG_00649 [Plasmodium falciparum HB3]|uniref:RRM domain-containing protein n=1 Tax=Plasmodium falciparum (isolate HB3) TaxID=137071 RepID=A0A0L7K717_PLAFX|nr:hypothetical protein PFHG_00649 [Plasmodium falciparum HB3]
MNKSLLKHFCVLNVPIEDNPFVTINLFVSNYKDQSNTDSTFNETLCVGILDNIIKEEDIKNYFSKYGKIKCLNIVERKYLSNVFKIFSYCLYITFVDNDVIEKILSCTMQVDEYFTKNKQSPYLIHMSKNKLLNDVKKYYDNSYNLYNGRKIMINYITNLNKDNKLLKKKKDIVGEDGFIRRADFFCPTGKTENPEFLIRVLGTTRYVNLFSKRNQQFLELLPSLKKRKIQHFPLPPFKK